MNEPTIKLRFEQRAAAVLKYRAEMRKAAALALAAACASVTTTRNSAQSGQLPGTAGSSGEAPEILRLEGGVLVPPAPRLRNRFGVSYRPSFNITAEFKNIGIPPSSVPGPGAGPVDRNYDNGYVRLETTGLAAGSPDGYTSYWSYQDNSQVVGNNLIMSKASSAGTIASSGTLDDDPQQGVELFYARELGPVGRFSWGVESSVGFASLGIRDARSLTTDVNITTDTFDISNLEDGGGPPPAPGTPSTGRSGTSALILVEPAARSTTLVPGASINGHRSVEADVFDFRVGPYVQFQLAPRLDLALSGGLGLALIDSSFDYSESLQLPGAGEVRSEGHGSESDVLVGGYVAANLSYSIAEAWRVFAGAQYRSMGTFSQSVNGAEVILDFGNAVYATLGVGYSF